MLCYSVTLYSIFTEERSYFTIEGVVELGAADVLLAEPGWATLRRKQLAADRLIGPVVALFNSVARQFLLQAQAALASGDKIPYMIQDMTQEC